MLKHFCTALKFQPKAGKQTCQHQYPKGNPDGSTSHKQWEILSPNLATEPKLSAHPKRVHFH